MTNHNKINAFIFILGAYGYSSAAISATDLSEAQLSIDRIEKERQQNFIKEEKQREQRFLMDKSRGAEQTEQERRKSRYSFLIKDIVVENDSKYAFSPERNAIIQSYLNSNMGELEIIRLVEELTNFYIRRGYATTLVTVIPGSLRSEKLVLRVLWGKIAGFRHNGEAPGWREKVRLFSAMPFAKDKILNMSDLDQGLDNLLRVSSSDKLLIEAAEKTGYSNINHVDKGVFPLSVYLGVNNSGYRNDGWYQYTLNTSLKNILGVNDTLTYFYSYNDLDAKDDSQSSKSVSLNLPLGYWLFDASWYHSKYKKVIGGDYGGYVSDGESERLSVKASRTLYRNASGKYSGYLKVEKRSNNNYIMDYPIAVSSKNYSNINAGFNWVGSLGGGWGFADLSMTAGLPWFDAAWKHDSDLAGFDIDYKKYNGTVSWSKRLATSASGLIGLDYELNSGFQFTKDRLVSDAKYNMGDGFAVRGYKESSILAERALYLSNTVKLPVHINYARINNIAPYAGFDIGMARKNCPENASSCERDYLSGVVAGLKVSAKDFSGSFSSGWPVKKPASLKHTVIDNNVLHLNFSVGF